MTSYLDSQTTTDVKPEMITGVQTGNGIPHDKYTIHSNSNVRTNRKDDMFMQRRLYIDEAHTALDIFRFAVFFILAFINFSNKIFDFLPQMGNALGVCKTI